MATTGANYMAKSINFEKYDKIVKFDVRELYYKKLNLNI